MNTQAHTYVSAWYLHANVAKGYTYGVEQYYYAGVHDLVIVTELDIHIGDEARADDRGACI